MQQSHPLIHPHLQHPMLPQPEMEEEVVAVPSIDTYSQDTGPRQKQRHPKDVPHLVFDVTSDDGFHVRSDSCHGTWFMGGYMWACVGYAWDFLSGTGCQYRSCKDIIVTLSVKTSLMLGEHIKGWFLQRGSHILMRT